MREFYRGKLMRRITLFLFAALAVGSIDAASYQKTDGTIVNPILDVHGNVLLYSGRNLEPKSLHCKCDRSDAGEAFRKEMAKLLM